MITQINLQSNKYSIIEKEMPYQVIESGNRLYLNKHLCQNLKNGIVADWFNHKMEQANLSH